MPQTRLIGSCEGCFIVGPGRFTALAVVLPTGGASRTAWALHTGSRMTPERWQFVDSDRFFVTREIQDRATPPPAAHAEARRLVESWLATEFIGRGDAVEELVQRIAALLAERELRSV